MNEPGPPRFCAVGETVELAPRAPDSEATYAWTILETPDGSSLDPPSAPVWHLEPDVPGAYRLELEGPDGSDERLVRAFPDPRRTVELEVDRDALPAHDPEQVSVMGPFNDQLVGRCRPRLAGDTYVYETDLPPGTHSFGYVAGDDFENAVWDEVTVPGPGRPRLHLEGSLEDGEVVVTPEAVSGTDSEYADGELEVEYYPQGFSETAVSATTDGGARVDPAAIDGSGRLHAVAVGDRHSVADCLEIAVEDSNGAASGAAVTVSRPNDPPEWAESAVVYEIFVRSFTDDATFASFERRVPYLEHLGVDCVWLTPVLESPTDHGYHTTDYFDTASDLGTREAFESFVDRCHEADIRVVFDLVINHAARTHHTFDLSAADVPAYRDWYVWESIEDSGVTAADLEDSPGRQADPEAVGPPVRTRSDGTTEVAQYYFNWTNIPNLNYDSLAVRRFLLEVVEEWVDVVDGYRCDVAWGISNEFWMEVRDRLKSRDSEFLLLDETIPRDPEFAPLQFDVHYDTTLYGRLREIGRGERPAADVLEAATAPAREGFPDSSLHMRYVENHDEPRYLEACGPDALRAAAAAVLTLPGVPMIYYGQERGATGYRQPMPWEGDGELAAFHRRLVAARRESAALSRGDLADLEYETDAEAAVAFTRRTDAEAVVVALNFGAEPATVTVPMALESTDLVTGETVVLESTGDGTRLDVADVAVLPLAEPSP
ncbi:alpha-amylase family glycosyl hydrolase [Natrononativus amylolyticus]|uniref:alpha-amylase family glycosyl hydrolase n=1 Tax=Natrononativus amylolyticus TaxID=2963434 RepID=UPI0020CF5774|nr:alpha-amylase family glycosyl hydrolase [Natrononativus amylolyticus]